MHRAVLSAAEGGFYIQTNLYRLKQKNGLYGRTGEKRGGYQNEESGSY